MGKKYKRLYEQVYAFDNLWLAARKARCCKRHKQAVLLFEYDLEKNLFEIQQQLKDETYQFSPYTFFTIYEPQERHIAAAPYKDRVVHHAICNIIEPILDRAMIYDSYACRQGKGSHAAIERAQQFLRKNSWAFKLDIKKYFFTIDHNLLLIELCKKISDERLLRLLDQLLATYESPSEYHFFPSYDYHGNERYRPIGLPIGNLTSQLLANYFLTPLDRFIKEKLHIKHYLRYMDDAVLFTNSKPELISAKENIACFLGWRRLKLHDHKCQVFPARHGIKFLGFHIYSYQKKILRPNLQRFKRRWREKSWRYKNQEIPWQHVLLSLNGWLGFAYKEENRKIINQVLAKIPFQDPDHQRSFTFFA